MSAGQRRFGVSLALAFGTDLGTAHVSLLVNVFAPPTSACGFSLRGDSWIDCWSIRLACLVSIYDKRQRLIVHLDFARTLDRGRIRSCGYCGQRLSSKANGRVLV